VPRSIVPGAIMFSFLRWLHARRRNFVLTMGSAFGAPMFLLMRALSGESGIVGLFIDIVMCAGVGLFWGWGMWGMLGRENAKKFNVDRDK
jgi:ABC-type Na+ efflux pump permease subunit